MPKIAQDLLAALKDSPVLLVIALLNAVVIVGLYFVVAGERENKNEIEKMLIQQCGPQAKGT